jgi:hypothetical protein
VDVAGDSVCFVAGDMPDTHDSDAASPKRKRPSEATIHASSTSTVRAAGLLFPPGAAPKSWFPAVAPCLFVGDVWRENGK